MTDVGKSYLFKSLNIKGEMEMIVKRNLETNRIFYETFLNLALVSPDILTKIFLNYNTTCSYFTSKNVLAALRQTSGHYWKRLFRISSAVLWDGIISTKRLLHGMFS